jgi:hypothetical protein
MISVITIFLIPYTQDATKPHGMRTSCMTLLSLTSVASQSFFSPRCAAIALNRADRCGKTALKIFFGILRGIRPARLDSERNRPNQPGAIRARDARDDALKDEKRERGGHATRQCDFDFIFTCTIVRRGAIAHASPRKLEEIMRVAAAER